MVPRSCWALLLLCAAARFFGWLYLGAPPEELGTPPEVATHPHVPFEVTAGDEATRRELSPLDSYEGQVVVRLRLSCTDLSEEEATKLGMDPFSNQPSAEGLWMYPCTPGTEQPCGWLRLRLETPSYHSLQRPALDETLSTSGQCWVAQLTEDLARQMGNMSSCGAVGLQNGHQVVLSDLHYMRARARDIYSQLESNLSLLMAQERRIEEVMEKLRQVNRSLGLMLAAVEGAQSGLENHLQHFHAILDPANELGMGAGGQMGAGGCHPAGWSPSAVSTCVLHGSYFVLLVALLMPMPPRAILLLLFLASSALGELLGTGALSALLALGVAGQWLVAAACRGAGEAWTMLPQEEPRPRLTSTPDREHEVELLWEELERMEMSCLQEPSCLEQPPATAGDLPGLAGWVSPIPGGWRTKLSSCGATLELALGTAKRWEPKPCNSNQSLARDGSLLSLRSPCQGLTRAGQQCRKKAIPGQVFCHVHATSRASCSGLAMDLSPCV